MKKFLAGTLFVLVFAIALPMLSYGQSCRSRSYHRGRTVSYSYASYGYQPHSYRTYSRSYRSYCPPRRASYRRSYTRTYYRPAAYYSYSSRRPSFYRRHRNALNIAIGSGAGALLGGLLGGRRGVGYGLLAGGGASALYTYKLRPKHRRYYR